jgi:hypothetical protein
VAKNIFREIGFDLLDSSLERQQLLRPFQMAQLLGPPIELLSQLAPRKLVDRPPQLSIISRRGHDDAGENRVVILLHQTSVDDHRSRG